MPTDSEWTIIIPLVASLMGAGVGAWTAQWIAAQNKKNDERLKELRAANAAAAIAYGIAEYYLSNKAEIVKPMIDQFNRGRDAFIATKTKPSAPVAPVIRFNIELHTFRFYVSPYKELQDLVLEDVSAPIRSTMVVPILTRTLTALDDLATARNDMIKAFKKSQSEGKELDPHVYYGVPFTKGGVDATYANVLQSIADYTDDSIFFGQMLGDDLREYAIALRQTLPKAVQPLAPKIVGYNFSNRADIMPKRIERYEGYYQAYRPLRVLGVGLWRASFEAIALTQCDGLNEHWLS